MEKWLIRSGHLLCKHEDLDLNPSIHAKSWMCVLWVEKAGGLLRLLSKASFRFSESLSQGCEIPISEG